MTSTSSILATSLQDIEEAISDFRDSPFQGAENALARIVYLLDEEPLAGFLVSVLPRIDFDLWWDKTKGSVRSMVGSGTLEWPIDRAARVATQVVLCRAMSTNQIGFHDFMNNFFPPVYELSAHVEGFASKLLAPLVRDIGRLTESRPLPPILFEAMGRLPTSGDATLDELLQVACTKFKDPAPQARQDAIEKLWDAWERLKSLEVTENKRMSVEALLVRASSDPSFRDHLNREMKALTEIGNVFHIRHFETDRLPLTQPEQFDYLFHRLYALMHFLLFARNESEGDL